MGILALLFRIIPTLTPFIKEMIFGSQVPIGGRKRNPLIPAFSLVLALIAVLVCGGLSYWVSDIEDDANMELVNQKLTQDVAELRRVLTNVTDELNGAILSKRKAIRDLEEMTAKYSILKSETVQLQSDVAELKSSQKELEEKLTKVVEEKEKLLDQQKVAPKVKAQPKRSPAKPNLHNFDKLMTEGASDA